MASRKDVECAPHPSGIKARSSTSDEQKKGSKSSKVESIYSAEKQEDATLLRNTKGIFPQRQVPKQLLAPDEFKKMTHAQQRELLESLKEQKAALEQKKRTSSGKARNFTQQEISHSNFFFPPQPSEQQPSASDY